MASIGSGRVRVITRIRGSLNKDSERLSDSKPWILVSRPDPISSGSRVKISFTSDLITSNKQSYEVDECYEEQVQNEELFNREIKPLISGLFGGQNATVFAYGTRGSGKTYTLQGSEEEFGLVALTLDSILSRVQEEGKVVNLSVFEVCQDRIVNLLDPKRSDVLVFEDGGKIKLKGLSKVKVNSTQEFQRLYKNALNTRMQTAAELPHRSHIGCVMHIVSPQTENSGAKLVGKINFIDLASYEDSRRMSSDGLNMTETTRIKKSLNAVHNVLYALNAKEGRVPYRETKLTRMLQDSLGGSSRTLMVTCLNPSFSQETVQTISVASRSCIAGFLANLDASKSGRNSNKTTRVPSPQIMKSASKLPSRTNLMSPKVVKPMSASASARKHTSSLMSARKASGSAALQKKGRKLFVDNNQGKTPKQENVCPVVATASMDSSAQSKVNTTLQSEETVAISTQPEVLTTRQSEATVDLSTQLEVNSTLQSEVTSDLSTQLEEKFASDEYSETGSAELLSEKETSNVFSDVNSSQLLLEEDVTATPCAYKTPTTASYLVVDKENAFNDGPSPPLSARLRDLSNNLKSLCISTESNLKMTQDSSRLFNQTIHENSEPRTPMFHSSARACEKYEKANNASPWRGVKDSLVHESLKFLNSAKKEELKRLRGIGEKRSTYILELRDESPEHFKELDDLKDIGLSEKQIKELVKSVAGNLLTS